MKIPSFWTTFGPLLAINIFTLIMVVTFFFVYKSRPRTAEIEERHSSVILNKWIREFWFWLTHPIFVFFVKFRVSPNAISILGSVGALLAGLAFVFGKIGLGGWVMVFAASLDFFDGRVARALNKETLAGSYIDSCMDRVSEGLTLIGIAYMYRNSFVFWIIMLAFLGSQLTSYTKAKGETMGIDYSGGMMHRPERIAYLGAGAIIAPMIAYLVFPFAGKIFPSLDFIAFEAYFYAIPIAFVAFFSTTTSINRIVNIMRLLDKKQFGESHE